MKKGTSASNQASRPTGTGGLPDREHALGSALGEDLLDERQLPVAKLALEDPTPDVADDRREQRLLAVEDLGRGGEDGLAVFGTH
jgi:hypothetical protein